MHLFYDPGITGPHHAFNEEESRHCAKVLRLGVGDEVFVTDGRGTLCRVRLTSVSPKRCTASVEEVRKEYGKSDYSLVMGVAPTKNADRFEWFLEKATEIGIDGIVPLLAERSERKKINGDRCLRILAGAMKQSLKAYLPEFREMTSFAELVRQPFEGDRFIAHCHPGEDKPLLRDAVTPGKSTLVLIGPEGDFSPEEVELARRHGFRDISLGSSRLRTETAAVVACHTVALLNE